MKPLPFALPLIVLVAGIAWLGMQRNSASALEKRNEELRAGIASHSTSTNTETAGEKSSARNPKPKPAAKPKKIDWKDALSKLGPSMRGEGVGDIREIVRFQTRLQALSAEELLASLDDIAALDVSETERTMLEQMILGPLVQKDPKAALDKFSDRPEDERGGFSWVLSSALGEWSKKDPVLAAAWLDERIAAGKFESKSLDGKSQMRSQFEGALISTLLSSDPEAANRRVASMPENQRADALRPRFSAIEESDQAAFAKIVRGQLPQKEQVEILGNAGSHLVMKDYAAVTGYLERINATPEERKEVVSQAANQKISILSYSQKVGREDIDSMREWASKQSPDSVDEITGTSLGSLSRQGKNNSFEDVSALAVQYHEASGNDEVMVSFLKSPAASGNKEQARILAEKISDATRRQEILKRLK